MIYLDYNATTPIDKQVADSMLPFIFDNFGNPSSSHELGVTTKRAVEQSRQQVADLLNCQSEEIIFTSGGSEANNMVIKGVAYSYKNKGNHIITSQIEHPAVLNPCKYLERLGYEISYVPVDPYGIINITALEKLITDKTILVTIMHSNNETGTLQPIKEISDICHKHNILFHTDASQSIGKVPVDVKELGIDFLTVAGHKLYAPKGIGALYVRKGISIEPLIHGAGHESGRRAGTENIIFDVALGKACEIAKETLKSDSLKLMTEYFYNSLKVNFGEIIVLNGHPEKRLPNTLNISFIGFNGHEVLNGLDDVAASTGSACHSGLTTISPVLKAMGVSDEVGHGAVRFSLGRFTTKDEIDTVISKIYKVLR
ncbi:MAG TPA: cysteine desulfurase family protein [Clostridia bacterium]|nr:cysteine desulfurase family protein [Clostridia bacterium]